MSHRQHPHSRRHDHQPTVPSRREWRRYTLTHRGRQFSLRPWSFWSLTLLVMTMAVWSAGTATYFVFRDDLLTRLMSRQVDMQYAYEDRIAELRTQVDRLTSRQLLDQEQVEQRIEHLARRQSLLETRSAAISGLPDPQATGSIRPRAGQRTERGIPFPARPAGASDTVTVSPAPDRHSRLESRQPRPRMADGTGRAGRPGARLASIEESMDRVEAGQRSTLVSLEEHFSTRARRIRGVLSELGLAARPPAADAASGVGGPFIPLTAKADADAFDRQIRRIELARVHVERLNQTLVAVPVRRPIGRDVATSSGFGARLDPFTRQPALHSGLDFRAPTGEAVRATGAGTVISAGWNGGYGRMVEIDHGHDLTTRYAHLSDISVREGERVRPGQVIGRVGSTGRSTGPHLHYETRVDGEAVDPQKFLRAGLRLGDAL